MNLNSEAIMKNDVEIAINNVSVVFKDNQLGRSMEHGQPQRSPRRNLDTHTPGIDRSERLAFRPGNPKHFALGRAEPADNIVKRRHSL